MKKESDSEVYRCSFCNKSQTEVRKLIAGPNTFICDECIDVCNEILVDAGHEPVHVVIERRREKETRKDYVTTEIQVILEKVERLPYSDRWVVLKEIVDNLMKAHLKNPM